MVHKDKGLKENNKVERNVIKEKREEFKIMYTNVDEIISRKLELRDYLENKTPNVVCITETKLDENITDKMVTFQNYITWRKDSKGKKGEGVIILTKVGVEVTKTEYGSGKAEVMSLHIRSGKGEKLILVVAYIPPKTSSWTKEQHEVLLIDTQINLERVIKSGKRVILIGDFNCSEVKLENNECSGEDNSWGNRLLKLTMENAMKQWVTENTRYKGENEPIRLDLVLTKGIHLPKEINYDCPFGKVTTQ